MMTATRNTPRKWAILRMLEADYDDSSRDSFASEFGRPPFPATTIAQYIDWFGGDNGRPKYEVSPGESIPNKIAFWYVSPSTVQSFARTLRGMAKEGLLIQVREKQQTMNGIAGQHIDMPRVAYYSPKAMGRNIEAAEAERAHRRWLTDTPEGRAHQEAQFEAFCRALAGAKAASRCAPRLSHDVIDGCIREVSPANDTVSASAAAEAWIPF